jgi:hypothetical protein
MEISSRKRSAKSRRMSSIGRGSVSMSSMLPKKRAAVGDHGVQQPGLAAELDVDGTHGHMGFARNHLQADLAVAFFQEQAAGRVQQGGAAGGFVGGAGGRRPCRSTAKGSVPSGQSCSSSDGSSVRSVVFMAENDNECRHASQKMKCNRFIS